MKALVLPPAVLRHVDHLGMTLSAACAFHCAFQPLLLMALPFMGMGFLLNERAEGVFLLFSVLMAFWGVRSGVHHHGQKRLWFTWALAVALIGSSRLVHEGEMPLAVAGACAIVVCHLQNRWALKQG